VIDDAQDPPVARCPDDIGVPRSVDAALARRRAGQLPTPPGPDGAHWIRPRGITDGASRRDVMASNEPFGFDPDDLDRFFPGAGDQLRGALSQFARMLNASGEGRARSGTFDETGRARRGSPVSETTGDTGEGVWMIYTVDADGDARVEQVFATELEALRANKHNTDSNRMVRFLPYGMPVTVLDAPVAPPPGDGPAA
jgi:hypothetical protein